MLEKKKTGKTPSTDTARIREHLKAMTPEGLVALNANDYRKRTHHHVKDSLFNVEKYRAKKALGIPARAKKPPATGSESTFRLSGMTTINGKGSPKNLPVLKVPHRGKSFEIIASVDMEMYKELPFAKLKAFAGEVLKAFAGAGDLEILMLSDPPTLEIRREVQ